MTGAGEYATHEVVNQPKALADYNAYHADATLRAAVHAFDAEWADVHLVATGISVGSAHVQDLADQANRFPPELRTHDRYGHRIDQIDFHPAWHELMALAIAHETHSLAWTQVRPGAHVARAALLYLWSQAENGICCPISMTHAAVPVLRKDSAIAAEWEKRLLSTRYDPRQIEAPAKTGATAAMAMTEKQGGSDLRQTQTAATHNGDGTWSITGHKWFFSAPHSDVFLTLARTERGISCFVVPGWLPDGSRNRLLIQRLKNKCGNRSNASSEVEFRGTMGVLLGEEGHGIRTLVEMAHLTRLDCAASSAALTHHAVLRAAHHCAHRTAFQRHLIEQPLMTNVLADLSVEAQAATWLAFRVIAACDREQDEAERMLGRIGAPIAKYWICKRAGAAVAEALECQGGNAFIEDNPMARLYREAPLNSLWEGSGNVICLDVLRSIAQEPAALAALRDEIVTARGADRRFDAFLGRLTRELPELQRDEGQARRLVEMLALALSASLLIRHAPADVADAFVASRLGGSWSGHFGDLPARIDTGALARAVVPAV